MSAVLLGIIQYSSTSWVWVIHHSPVNLRAGLYCEHRIVFMGSLIPILSVIVFSTAMTTKLYMMWLTSVVSISFTFRNVIKKENVKSSISVSFLNWGGRLLISQIIKISQSSKKLETLRHLWNFQTRKISNFQYFLGCISKIKLSFSLWKIWKLTLKSYYHGYPKPWIAMCPVAPFKLSKLLPLYAWKKVQTSSLRKQLGGLQMSKQNKSRLNKHHGGNLRTVDTWNQVCRWGQGPLQ